MMESQSPRGVTLVRIDYLAVYPLIKMADSIYVKHKNSKWRISSRKSLYIHNFRFVWLTMALLLLNIKIWIFDLTEAKDMRHDIFNALHYPRKSI